MSTNVTEDTKLRTALEGILLWVEEDGRLTIHDGRLPHNIRFTDIRELALSLQMLIAAGAEKWRWQR